MPVVPDPVAIPITGNGLLYSPLSMPVSITIPFTQWWLTVPERPHMSLALMRLATGSAPSNKTAGVASFNVDQLIEEGVFHPFAGPADETPINAIITHGAIEGEELDVSMLFQGDAAHDAFVAIKNAPYTCLLQSDQTKQWYVDLGSARSSVVMSTADRKKFPIWVESVHVIQQDAP